MNKTPAHTKFVEIDITKAYTAAFIKIKEIPVFNEFDTFKPYNRQDIEDKNLYKDKATSFNLFLNIKFQFAFRQSELHAFSYWIFSPLAVSSFAGKICKKVFRGQYDKTFFTLAT